MEIIKLIGIGLVSVVIIVILKQYKPEFALYVSLIAGIIILAFSFDSLTHIFNLLENFSEKISVSSKFVTILLKITGIAILAEFACSICRDCGESSVASKIDIGSKIIIISSSIPIIASLLEVILNVMP